MNKLERLQRLVSQLEKLSSGQIAFIESLISELQKPTNFRRNPESDLINDCVLQDFGDVLRIHHCFSKEPFTKDKFEYALERVLLVCGFEAKLATRGNPGHDITIEGTRFSLKTQADQSIKQNKLHISKFMELGKGNWNDREEDLRGLLVQFFKHMQSYDRILSMRKLSPADAYSIQYELVEIPKNLLLEAEHGFLEMRFNSKQTPKPGYCHVRNSDNTDRFQLYFDGGTERKLQIKNLDKNLCITHAEWIFEAPLKGK